MSTPFDGVGIWVWPAFWGGTDLTPAEAEAYAAAGVKWAAIKCSDGTTGDPGYPAQNGVARDAGLLPIPWCFIKPGGNETEQAQIAWQAAGSPAPGAIMLCDIESAINVGDFAIGMRNHGLQWACTTWGNPTPDHDGEPSIGQLADVGCIAFLPQAYYSDWQVTPQSAIQSSVTNYKDLNLGAFTKPLLPIVDGPDILAAAQVAVKLGCNGISGWRHGASGITPASFNGVAALFAPPPTPTPTPPPTPTVLAPGTYSLPSGAVITIS